MALWYNVVEEVAMINSNRTRMASAPRKVAFLVVLMGFTSLSLMLLAWDRPIQNEAPPMLTPRMGLQGIRVATIEEAESLAGFVLAVPTYLPPSLSLQEIRFVSGQGSVYLIFGPTSLPLEGVTWTWLLLNGYWTLDQRPADVGVSVDSLIDSLVDQSGGRVQPINVNGSPGTITCPGDGANEIQWWSCGIHYTLITPQEATYSELLEVAESVSLIET
ncbi:MAG: hypothetical protein ACUVT7_04845 [Thermoplasmata archaeon]